MILPNIEKTQKNPSIHDQVLFLLNDLYTDASLTKEQLLFLLDHISKDELPHLYSLAYKKKYTYYQDRVYMRGLLEISNHCIRGCHYCGIHRQNKEVSRYRLSKEQIYTSIDDAHRLGYKTYVLQGGEDPYFTDELLEEIIKEIKKRYPQTRITLSLGERSYASYKRLYDAGADRYLLRHETASKKLYKHLHPKDMSLDIRKDCLTNLKEIGYQVGAGFMVHSPKQTNQDLVEDLLFLKELNPDMIGIGPFLAHSSTVYKDAPSGTLEESLVMVALARLMHPEVLLPATTALGSLHKIGREKALKVGANVLMPNISPTETRKDYEIYENKICTDDTADHCRNCIESRVVGVNHQIDLSMGDPIYIEKKHQH
jgi:biotin synthase